ncbi:GNAT family N-acetyltransferase, partial [Staphylococcus succinus]
MVIRKATQSDLAMIDRMIPKVFKESMDTKINLTDETMQSMSRALVHQGAAYYIFVEDGKVKGFILIDFKKDDIAQHDYGFIYELYVIDLY